MQQNSCVCSFTGSDSWVILSPIEQSIKRKIESVGTPLSEWDINIYRGVLTGYNDAFIISTEKRDEILAACKTEDERSRTAELIRPILRGRDIKRYSYDWAGLWLIATFPSRHYNINDYPSVKNFLLSFGIERLEQTGTTRFINGQKVQSRKKTNNKWFEVQDSISYWEDFDKPKLIYGEISREPKFYLDTSEHFYPEATSFIMVGEHIDYIYTLLLSKPITLFFKLFYAGGGLGEDGYRYKKAFLERLPIPKFNSSILQIQLIDMIPQCPIYTDSKINQLIYKLYNLNDEECQYIDEQIV